MKTKKLFQILFACVIVGLISFTSLAQNSEPYDIQRQFIASGYMGDTGNIQLVSNHTENCHSDSRCIRATYFPGRKGWAGVYWQYPADNWCKKPGKNLSDSTYTRVTFWARGESGNEEVKFKSGHDCGDSYTTEDHVEYLTTEWVKYSIDIKGRNLSNITGAFCWVVDSHANTGKVTFYLDDIKFE